MDFKLSTDAKGNISVVDGNETSVINNIILSLAIPLGGWWFNPKFGSTLHLLTREKATPETAAKVKESITSALKWMVSAGLLSFLDITTEVTTGRINYRIVAVQADGKDVKYSNFVEVI